MYVYTEKEKERERGGGREETKKKTEGYENEKRGVAVGGKGDQTVG